LSHGPASYVSDLHREIPMRDQGTRSLAKNKWGKYVLKVLRGACVYFAVPPYNLAWFRSFRFAEVFLAEHPISVIDIGARNGSCEELANLYPCIDMIGFDADEVECLKLNEKGNPDFRSYRVYPSFVGVTRGPQQFNLYKNRGNSSQLLPNPEFQKSFQSNFAVESTVTVQGITLDDFVTEKNLDIDFLKLDSQGTEYDILANGTTIVESALMIECEVEFVEMYLNQKLFHEIFQLLHERGFVLLYLNRVFANRTCYRGTSRGQVIFGDALFGLSNAAVKKLSWEKKKKYCLLLINYGLIDYAYELLEQNPDLNEHSADLQGFFERRNRSGIVWKIVAGMWMQVEKLIYVLLLLRKTNRINHDSDRSWPVR